MGIIVKPKEYLLFNAFMLIFIIHTNQVGIGILGFQRIIFRDAGKDAWICVILAGVVTHIVAWVMIKTLELYQSTDIYGIHQDVYGKIIGGIVSSIYIVYLILLSVIPVRNYVEIVQSWLFPEMPTWLLAILMLFLAWYCLLGGIRTVVGISFFGVVIPMFLVFFLAYPYKYSEWSNLFPILEASIPDLLKGTYNMGLTIIGFEILYFIYPFVKEKHLVSRYTHLGLAFTTLLYLIVMIVSSIYYGDQLIMKYIWATLNLFKIVQMPILERFEFLAVAIWMFVIFPNLVLTVWAATRGVKRIFNWKQKYALYPFLIINFVISLLITSRIQMDAFNDMIGKFSPYLVFIYPFLIYALARWKCKRDKKKGKSVS